MSFRTYDSVTVINVLLFFFWGGGTCGLGGAGRVHGGSFPPLDENLPLERDSTLYIAVCECFPGPDDLVTCYSDNRCTPASQINPPGEPVTTRECCANTTAGLSIVSPYFGACFVCIGKCKQSIEAMQCIILYSHAY